MASSKVIFSSAYLLFLAAAFNALLSALMACIFFESTFRRVSFRANNALLPLKERWRTAFWEKA